MRPRAIRDQKLITAKPPSEEWSKKTVAHPASTHTPRHAHDDSETPDRLVRLARAICPTLHSKVAGARGKGTGARIPYLQRIADIGH